MRKQALSTREPLSSIGLFFKSRRSQGYSTSSFGIIAITVGGLSALWGSLASISYQSSFKQILKDFQVKDIWLIIVLIHTDFLPLSLAVPPIVGLASRAFSLCELEEIGWFFHQLCRKKYLIFQLL